MTTDEFYTVHDTVRKDANAEVTEYNDALNAFRKAQERLEKAKKILDEKFNDISVGAAWPEDQDEYDIVEEEHWFNRFPKEG